MTFDDLYVGMTLDNIDLGSAPQTFKVLEIDRTNKRIYVEGILGKTDTWEYPFIQFALGLK